MEAIVCDRCGKVLTERMEKKEISRIKEYRELTGTTIHKDLCSACAKDLVNFFKGELK